MCRRIAVLLALMLVTTSCAAFGQTDEASSDASTGAPPQAAAAEEQKKKKDKYDGPDSTYIFEQDQLHTFEIDISEANLAELDRDPRAEEYVDGMLSFEGESFGEVGVRYKGSIGAFFDCLTGVDPENGQPTGPKTCSKLSMKIKINWDGSKARFYDLRKLQLHSQNSDATQMHERLGYWIFAEMDVPAPRSVHARVLINGEFAGVFALTEEVEGRFANEHFEDGSGNVFKQRWPLDTDNNATHERVLAEGLKTNEEEDAAPLFAAFGEALAGAMTDEELRAVIEKYMDVEQTMSYIAVDRAIANDDGIFHFYCFGGCANNNYYWYADPTTQKLHLIPWDLGDSFDNILEERNPVTPIADDWPATSNDCQAFTYGRASFPQRSAACDRLLAGLALFDTEYQAALDRLLAGPFAEGVIEARLAQWSAQIDASTAESHALHPDTVSMADWNAALDDLRAAIAFARAELVVATS